MNSLKIKSKVVQCDGNNVDSWAPKALTFLKNEKIVISLWFLIHEIANNSTVKIVKFLNKIKKYFPNSILVICELVEIPSEILSINRKKTFIPEYLFFHSLSGQTVLSLKKLNEIIKLSDFKLDKKISFDNMESQNNASYPSCVLFYLK